MKWLSGFTSINPEKIIITWMFKKDIPRSWHSCDVCNGDLDAEPFPVLHVPEEGELANSQHIPEGSWALCKRCAAEIYGLLPSDRDKLKRIWYCRNLMTRQL